MPLSKEIKDRIAKEALRQYPANRYMSDDLFFTRQAQQESYIAGAEAETERAAELISLYRQLVEVMNDELNAMESYTKDYKANRERVVMWVDLQKRIREAHHQIQ